MTPPRRCCGRSGRRHGLAERWTEAGLAGGARGAQADRDLDAVVALFDSRGPLRRPAPARGPRASSLTTWSPRRSPATRSPSSAPDADAVRILDRAPVQGPGVGRRGGRGRAGRRLARPAAARVAARRGGAGRVRGGLGPRRGRRGRPPPSASKLLAEERRLFYVAATRARRRLVVTAVGGDDTDERPSRFLAELRPGAIRRGVDRRAGALAQHARAGRRPAFGRRRPDTAGAAAHGRRRPPGAGSPRAGRPGRASRRVVRPHADLRRPPAELAGATSCASRRRRWRASPSAGCAGCWRRRSALRGSDVSPQSRHCHPRGRRPRGGRPGRGHPRQAARRDLGRARLRRRLVQPQAARGRRADGRQVPRPGTRTIPGSSSLWSRSRSRPRSRRASRSRAGSTGVERDADGRAVIIDIKTGASKPADSELGPPPAARRLPARRAARRLRARTALAEPGGAALVQVGKAAGKAPASSAQRALADDPEPRLGRGAGRHGRRRHGGGPVFTGQVNDGCRTCAAKASCPVNEQRGPGVLTPLLMPVSSHVPVRGPRSRGRGSGGCWADDTRAGRFPDGGRLGPRCSARGAGRKLGIAAAHPRAGRRHRAPLEPMVVVAGAGSGKSETMAGRVVWLVANGLVRPERVLGLTFTRKAAAELAARVRKRLSRLAEVGLAPPELLEAEPTVSTYHAYAARLVTDHALREALEPTMRLVTPAVSWQIAARVVGRYDGPMDRVDLAPPSVTAAVLDLAGELSEHLRTPDEVREIGHWLDERFARLDGRPTLAQRRPVRTHASVSSSSRWSTRTPGSSGAARSSTTATRWPWPPASPTGTPRSGVIERGRFSVVLLDEYQDTSHAQLVLLRALFGGGHPGHGGGRPLPVDLRLARRLVRQPQAVRPRLPHRGRRARRRATGSRSASATASGSWTSPPGCRCPCARRRGRSRCSSPASTASRAAGSSRRSTRPPTTRPRGSPTASPACSARRPLPTACRGGRASATSYARRSRPVAPTAVRRLSSPRTWPSWRANGRSSRRCAGRSRPGGSRSRWSASAAC